ncbi:ciliary-associated calcium-binding coiled-coil protein 1 [Gastrophryne carolinensis]
MENFLGFKDTDTDLKEAILVDYFVSGVCWGKEKHFNTQQLTAFLELLHFLMENIKVRRLSLQENIIKMAQAMAVIGRNLSKTTGKMSCFDVEQAKNIITYLNIRLLTKEEKKPKAFHGQMIAVYGDDAPSYCQGAEEPREEPTKNTDRAATVLSQATSDARGKLQAKIKEKLTIQEEASTAKIENVKKP